MTRAVWCLMVLSACGCRRRAETPPPATDATSIAPLPVIFAGIVVDGRFFDRGGRFSLAVPGGWTTRPGQDQDALRVTLRHAETGTVVQVWRYPGESLTPRPRAECTWLFQDQGPYRTLRVAGPVGAATCIPDTPGGPRTLAWLHATSGETWSLDVLPDPVRWLVGLDAGEAVLSTARWRASPVTPGL